MTQNRRLPHPPTPTQTRIAAPPTRALVQVLILTPTRKATAAGLAPVKGTANDVFLVADARRVGLLQKEPTPARKIDETELSSLVFMSYPACRFVALNVLQSPRGMCGSMDGLCSNNKAVTIRLVALATFLPSYVVFFSLLLWIMYLYIVYFLLQHNVIITSLQIEVYCN